MSLFREATTAETEMMFRTVGGHLPPGTYAVLGGTLPGAIAERAAALVAAIDRSLPPTAFQQPRHDDPAAIECWELLREFADQVADTMHLVVGVGRSWDAMLMLSPPDMFLGAGRPARIEFERRRQGMLESSRGFFAQEDR